MKASLSFMVILSCLVGLSLSDDKTTTTTSTTSKPTTSTASTTTSTTPAPSTTTAKPEPTTTPAPHVEVKSFPENIGNWNVTDSATNITCVKVNAAIQLSVNYEAAGENKTKEAKVGKVDVPETAVASGKCDKESQTLTLTWTNKDNKTNQVEFTFALYEDKNKTTGNFSLTSITVTIVKDNVTFPNATEPETPIKDTLKATDVFSTPLNNSYRCNADFEVKPENATVIVDFQNSQVEAFRSSPSNVTDFSKEYICTADKVASQSFWMTFFVATFVVLILAAAMAALVMFVIRKRRSRVGSGYENM